MPSSPLHQMVEAQLTVPEEQIAHSFLHFDAPQKASSYVSEHLEKVEMTLAREIPIDKTHVAELRSSLFKIADSAEVHEVKKNAFMQISL